MIFIITTAGDDHLDTWAVMVNLGHLLTDRGELEEAGTPGSYRAAEDCGEACRLTCVSLVTSSVRLTCASSLSIIDIMIMIIISTYYYYYWYY